MAGNERPFSRGGFIPPWPAVIELARGPKREAIDPGHLTVYEDECIINTAGVCVRNDKGHLPLCGWGA